ncbi:MAG: hypothetical protein ABJN26_16340 [Stappiaceae bacterium]
MVKREDQHAEKVRRAEAALKRVELDSETAGASSLVRMAEKSRSHFSADDADQEDRTEVWGRRIGRGLGLVFLIGLIVYLSMTYL